MTPFRADLHCHSTCSDGTLTPEQLLYHAKEKQLSALSITDHDTIDAYTPSTLELAKQLEIDLLSGVEFSTAIGQVSVHLLGYGFSLKSPDIADLCARHKSRRAKRYRAILERLGRHGMPIHEEKLLQLVRSADPGSDTMTVGRPHIAQMMVQCGYVKSVPEAFKKYLGDNRPCNVQGEQFTPEETLEVIHKAGGVAIIAHPHLIQEKKILRKLLAMPFDGIECYYSKFPMEDHNRWVEIALERGWLITGGSDFHGNLKPLIPLGCSWIDQDNYDKLKSRALHFPS